jgi:electron transport complex protein RnfB
MINLLLDNVVLASLLALIGLGGMFGGLLGYAAEKFKINSDPVIDTIDELLPQTQCGQCGFPGRRPYAQSIADGDAINKCPPGGQTTINAIAKLLDITAVPLDEEHGQEELRTIAYIREDECIGCTKCIQACPVDAILGSAKLMHTVIEKECTGCDLCVDPCPVDCIDMLPVKTSIDTWYWPSPENIPPSTTSAYTEGHAS